MRYLIGVLYLMLLPVMLLGIAVLYLEAGIMRALGVEGVSDV